MKRDFGDRLIAVAQVPYQVLLYMILLVNEAWNGKSEEVENE